MAEGEAKDNKDVKEKLKELEASLAKELDQKVRLSEPSDPRLEGGIDVNPNMAGALQKAKEKAEADAAAERHASELAAQAMRSVQPGPPQTTQTPPAQPAGNSTDVEAMTQNDVDDLLKQLDPSFFSGIEELKQEVSKVDPIPSLESISIGVDYLKDADIKEESEPELAPEDFTSDDLADLVPDVTKPGPESAGFGGLLFRLAIETAALPVRVAKTCVRQLISLRSQRPKEVLLGSIPLLAGHVRSWLEVAARTARKAVSYPRRVYLIWAAIAVLMAAIGYLGRDAALNYKSADRETDPFLRSFNGVADSVQAVPIGEDDEDLESPLKHPEYTVLVHRMVANLKAADANQSPMVAVELYVEASNQEAAIEIHNREKEVQDIVERVLEETPFDDIDTGPGKQRLKIRIKNGVNRILNRGTVKHIYFKNLNFAD